MDAELRTELMRREKKDQAARRADDMVTVMAVDAENLPWLKQVIAEVGWPGTSTVGKDGAHAAWLLVQHADRDPAFQRTCLDLMTAAVERGEATRTNLAYLTDRVLLAEGEPQEYGTQALGWEGGYVARNLRDPDGVDERRAQVGLGPLATYLAGMTEHYGPSEPARTKCPACGSGIEFWLPDEGSVTLTCAGCGETMNMAIRTSPGRG